MTDLWSFLLQTLTASGAAALLLCVKAMFRDKLSPRWQFAVWGVLALVLLLPAGRGGRYVLLNWPLVVEALKSRLTGDFGTLTQVVAPVPLPPLAPPRRAADWLYAAYAAGAALLAARYVVSYVRLRLILRRGRPAQGERVRAVGSEYGLPACPAVEVDGLPTAFICGVFKPVLALPAGGAADEKVILHELLHLKYQDVAWGWVIAFFRCVHWCNPLLWLCADRAGNDLESLCDQRVLERLEGEDRRDYGRILLSMADERYARAPGTSSAANGGRNIRRRIEAIARFKRYPAGMALASVCVALVLAAPLAAGARAETFNEWGSNDDTVIMASARTIGCTTCAGAFDAYANAVLMKNIPYRAMCAPLSQQNQLAAAFREHQDNSERNPFFGLEHMPNMYSGYYIYNLTPLEGGAYEGLLVIELFQVPPQGEGNTTIAYQPLRAEKEGDRWVILPQGEFQSTYSYNVSLDTFPCENLPAKVFEARYGDFTLRAQWQTRARVDSNHRPQPHGTFDSAYEGSLLYAVYTGDPAKKREYSHIAVSACPIYGDESPQLSPIDPGRMGMYVGGHSTGGESWGNKQLEGDWEDEIFLSGGGGSFNWERDGDRVPARVAAELYLNYHPVAELTLLPVEGGAWVEY